jgi:hypothetical protein
LDLHGRDNDCNTALHWAAYAQAEVAFVYLLAWVNSLEDQDKDGNTPLHKVIKQVESVGHTRFIRQLLIRGASRTSKDNLGRTPMDLVLDHVKTLELQ